ncbi:hypothetical protein [Nocardioides bizhenqiangii]|uniref:Uncharacterized protein n=1 Tax=Nocardioides bizhenqiangii TaxID=3095076 RepID=A0ABZ0ZVV1_9ACTN|nr:MULTISPECIES: hypothetical protein [unclassified Nocardioides]MDZ5622976.1 hypothetical protein [Nocardioides sp. HM23]WQQ27959.1 hypothetical protein SHK19_06915 [Nocardioides sp. HM61]
MSQATRNSPVTGFVLEDRDGTQLLTLTIPGIVVRVLTVAPIAVALAELHRVAPDVSWWPSFALLVLAVGSAGLPDSGVGLVTLGGLVAWWLVAVQQPATWSALVVGCCGLVFHVALAHAAAGPPGFAPTRAVVGRLALRCAGVLLATGGVAAVVEVAEEGGEPPVVVVAITLALVGALPWVAVRRSA